MKLHILGSLAVLCVTGPVAAGTVKSKADIVLAAAKRATGGKAWDIAPGCHEQGARADGAVPYTTRFSLTKYGMRVDSGGDGNRRSMGFDGKVRWQSAGTRTDIRADPDTIKEAILTNYLSINGFFFPARFPATFEYLREATEAGKKFDVLRITPAGTRSIEVWFDRQSHLIRRVVDALGTPPVTVEASDYRAVGAFTVAYKLTVAGADGQRLDTGTVTSFQCGPIDNMIFNPPAAH